MNDKALNFKIPEELYNALKKEADSNNISMAALVRMICSDYIKRKNEPAKEIPQAVKEVFDWINNATLLAENEKKPKK